MTFLLEYLA